MRTRRELLLGSLMGFAGIVAAARPAKSGPLVVTYYFLPG